MAAIELKVGLRIEAPGETWTVLRVYPNEVKVQVVNTKTGRVKNESFLRSKFTAALASAQAD